MVEDKIYIQGYRYVIGEVRNPFGNIGIKGREFSYIGPPVSESIYLDFNQNQLSETLSM